MGKCVNENCKNDQFLSSELVPWGCDFDAACSKYCYDEARKQMDREFGGGCSEYKLLKQKCLNKYQFIFR